MDQNRKPEAPFDEGAALAELEQFRKEIERYQALRQGADDEFGRFIRSFKESHPQPAAAPPRPAAASPAAAPARPIVPRPVAPPAAASPVAAPAERASRAPLILPPPEKPRDEEVALPELSRKPLPPAVEIAPPPASLVPPRRSTANAWLITGTAVAVLAIGGYAWTLRKTVEPTTTADVPPTTAPQTSDPAPRAPSSEQRTASSEPRTANSAQRSPFESELTTIRAVWVRVTADGERIVERELPARARIPFTARKTIVIRTGDAGAVRLTIGGQDRGALGREGEVVTRAFTVPASPPR